MMRAIDRAKQAAATISSIGSGIGSGIGGGAAAVFSLCLSWCGPWREHIERRRGIGGERGPELVDLPKGARVSPLDGSGGGGMGGDTFNFYSLSAADFEVERSAKWRKS